MKNIFKIILLFGLFYLITGFILSLIIGFVTGSITDGLFLYMLLWPIMVNIALWMSLAQLQGALSYMIYSIFVLITLLLVWFIYRYNKNFGMFLSAVIILFFLINFNNFVYILTLTTIVAPIFFLIWLARVVNKTF